MTITAEVIEDTESTAGARISTLQLRYPRFIHSEFMTHRVFSRNASSSRAIPYLALTANAEDMFIPKFRKNKPGMQPGDFLNESDQDLAAAIWKDMANYVTKWSSILADKGGLNIHKQWVNRPTEWFGHINVVVTSTEWDNFFSLRIHDDAQDEIHELADQMHIALLASVPRKSQMHLPYVQDPEREDVPVGLCKLLSAARCARTSYMTHERKLPDTKEDLKLAKKLYEGAPHLSPFEHAADASQDPNGRFANFTGWYSTRYVMENTQVAVGQTTMAGIVHEKFGVL